MEEEKNTNADIRPQWKLQDRAGQQLTVTAMSAKPSKKEGGIQNPSCKYRPQNHFQMLNNWGSISYMGILQGG